ncbi:MAG: DUF1800 domain-containing protein [Gammaproteobacteria bacterium]|nr:DUF1800 domain-containing protein [Gammaproteobacteria bacterium]
MRPKRDPLRLRLVLTAAAALFGAGCGGGSSDPGGAPPPAPGVSMAQAFRFLNQATFGATEAEAQRLQGLGDSSTAYTRWIDAQFQQPASLQLPHVQAAYAALPQPVQNIGRLNADRVDIWFRNAVNGPDQLRQRVAFALSEIMVVSQQSALNNLPFALADYYDMLVRNALGDFRQLMEEVTLHPAMGVYLSMLGNRKPDTALNIRPDENYARELMQLFSIGLVELNADGTPREDPPGQTLPTYDQSIIEGFAHVYTGWNWAGAVNFGQARPTLQTQVQPMQAYASQHDSGAKQLLDYPGAVLSRIPARNPADPARDLDDALDNIFNHPNVGPFIARQLIQRLITSNPSPAYVQRLAQVFANDGSGRRGNLGAVVRALLLDPEARGTAPEASVTGKLKEPLLRVTQLWRAYGGRSASGRYDVQNPAAAAGQGPLQAASVFNFFSPSYAPPGEITERGLVAPEMQIATEFLATVFTNYLFVQTFCYTSSPVTGCPTVRPEVRPDLVFIDVSSEASLAGNPPALVDRITARLLGGRISGTLQAQALAAVERVPAELTGLRVAEAMFLIVSSPEYAVQQ